MVKGPNLLLTTPYTLHGFCYHFYGLGSVGIKKTKMWVDLFGINYRNGRDFKDRYS
ncbi:hypothetical protein SAMN05421877_11296 [Sphingobacterium lactis]|uniref:Uncharacterized protein n=1 Tax=Sphingobacterium lactis TaxID=797291 RepID=A0A1H6BZR4_9SPHI|nr:hypothetical protein SAMN05421877_11296 [Sphingobacterium lactis]